MLSALLEQEHYGLRSTDFVQGYYPDEHPTMPGMAYLKLKRSMITKGNKIKGSAPTIFDSRNSRHLVHNPDDLLSRYRMYGLLRGFAHPYQEFIYCYTRPIARSLTSTPVYRTVMGSRQTQSAELGRTLLACSVRNSRKKPRSRTGISSETTAGASWAWERSPTIPT
jgi:hypothetical protein